MSTERPDGTNETDGAGESAGGAYPNPHGTKDKKTDGVMGHGGQERIAYSGPETENATTEE